MLLAWASQQGGLYSGYALALDFQNGVWRGVNGLVADISLLPGYSSVRAGTEIRLSSKGVINPFAANTPAIIPGDGYFSQAAVTNIMLQSQDFTNASWTHPPSVSGDIAVAPDGTTTADQIATTSATLPETYQLKTLSVTPYTKGYYFKKNASGTRWAYIFIGGGANALAFFDITNGVVGTILGSALNKAAKIVALPNGWFLALFTANATGVSNAYGCGWSTVDAVPTAVNGTGGLVWQAQLVLGNDLGPLIPTTTAAVASVQPALSFTVANGTYTETTTFGDGSTQTIPTTIAGGAFTMPVYPTTLNRPLVKSVTLK